MIMRITYNHRTHYIQLLHRYTLWDYGHLYFKVNTLNGKLLYCHPLQRRRHHHHRTRLILYTWEFRTKKQRERERELKWINNKTMQNLMGSETERTRSQSWTLKFLINKKLSIKNCLIKVEPNKRQIKPTFPAIYCYGEWLPNSPTPCGNVRHWLLWWQGSHLEGFNLTFSPYL